MREILFRGKATNRDPNRVYRTTYKNGDWVYGLITDTGNYMGFAEMTNEDGVSDIDVDKNTVGQYTELTDKNGTKIFEGDIVTGLFDFELSINAVATFRDGSFGVIARQHGIEHFHPFTPLCNVEFEVIGNIHDNPELLEVEK